MAVSPHTSTSSASSAAPPPTPRAPPIPPTAKRFDPLGDLLGIEQVGADAVTPCPPPAARPNQVALYTRDAPPPPAQATLDRTAADRVASVKGVMDTDAGPGGGHRFGVMNTNARITHAQQPLAAHHAAAYRTAAVHHAAAQQQQQQQMLLVAQQAMMTAQQYQQQQQQHWQLQQHGGMLPPGGAHAHVPRTHGAVPAMRAERVTVPDAQYRVRRGGAVARVSDSDAAFGPIIDELKKAVVRK